MNDNKPIVSIIIPCYNQGHYLNEALGSVEQYPDPSVYEVILVNDGSTDKYTIQTLQMLEQKGYHVINQDNQGLGAARNRGIKAAQGRYILPLDSDNRIRPEYISRSMEILDHQAEIGIVYGNHIYFGEGASKKAKRKICHFDMETLLKDNYIDACAVFRKTVWEDVGGYDVNMPYMGFEDWDFWLGAALHGWKFHFIDEPLFDYRVSSSSMNRKNQRKNKQLIYQYVYNKYFDPPFNNFGNIAYELSIYGKEINYFNQRPLNYFLKKKLTAWKSDKNDLLFFQKPLKEILKELFYLFVKRIGKSGEAS